MRFIVKQVYTPRGKKFAIADRIYTGSKQIHILRNHKRCVLADGKLVSVSHAGIARHLMFQKKHHAHEKVRYANELMRNMNYAKHVYETYQAYLDIKERDDL